MTQLPLEKRQSITFTVELDHKHDICLVRKLLKALLRIYRLKCVRIDSVSIVALPFDDKAKDKPPETEK